MANTYLSDEDYGFIFGNVPRICIDLLIRNSNGHILLALRNIPPYQNIWHFPGGGVRFKETFEDAASRISNKEFGSSVKLLREIGSCQILNDDIDEKTPRHSISVVFEAELNGQKIKTTDETKDIRFFEKLPLNMHPYHKDFILKHGISI